MGNLFGTDGIRGVAGAVPLDKETVYRVGYCVTQHLSSGEFPPRILVARDTRISGPWLQHVLSRAIADAGGVIEDCGVISTPAVSLLTIETGAHAGIMISASHNPFEDNGIKVFSGAGMKFSDAVEDEIESRIRQSRCAAPADLDEFNPDYEGSVLHRVARCEERYGRFLRGCVAPQFRLNGSRLVVDCAHGALSAFAPAFLESYGAHVHELHCRPDGRNINRQAGALHLERLQEEVKSRGADLGIAFDGDADRVMLVDRTGAVRDGDDVLYLLARYTDFENAPRVVVGTVMANLGLELALAHIDFRLVRTSVGDRYVLEEMLRLGAMVGGEQSGHVILTRFARTGDGLLTALKVLEIAQAEGRGIEELCAPVKRLPQLLVNVRVKEKTPFAEIPGLAVAEAAWRERLGPRSRILLRYSGTEKLARVMVEGEDRAKVEQAAREIAATFEP
jgi:phosphoglucosamine mutase